MENKRRGRGQRGENRQLVWAAMEEHLRHEPTKVSKSRIKRLRGLSHPKYRLRVGDDVRVFYDVAEEAVQVLAIVADDWLKKHGDSNETNGPVGNQG